MSVLYTDTIEITPVAYSADTKIQTEGTPVSVKGYWEEDSGIEYKDGLPIGPKEMVFFPGTVTIKKGDLLRLTKKGNIDVSINPDYTDKRVAKKVNIEVSLGPMHYEVKI